jgi:hypothetical protein
MSALLNFVWINVLHALVAPGLDSLQVFFIFSESIVGSVKFPEEITEWQGKSWNKVPGEADIRNVTGSYAPFEETR